MAILPDLSTATRDDLLAIIEALKSAPAQRVTFKITEPKLDPKTGKSSPGGAISVYGLGKFPLTLYISQWEKLIANLPALQDFAKANAHRLTTKART
jgi:hypothetical protein